MYVNGARTVITHTQFKNENFTENLESSLSPPKPHPLPFLLLRAVISPNVAMVSHFLVFTILPHIFEPLSHVSFALACF